MEEKKSIFKDTAFIVGLILIVVSFGIHVILHLRSQHSSSFFLETEGVFYINYIISIVYFLGTLFMSILTGSFKNLKHNYQKFICSLILFSISCYSINIPFPIFSKFSTWMNVYIVSMHVSLLALCFIEYLPKKIRIVNFFVLGLGAVLTCYFAIYLIPFSFLAIFGIILFGVGLHLLVPAMMLITILIQFRKRSETLSEKIAFYIGILIPFIIIGIYAVKWNTTKQLIHSTQASIVTRPENKLPLWVLMSQELGDDFFTERILKGDLVYETDMFGGRGVSGRSRNSLDEAKEHDPLVMIGAHLMGDVNLSQKDRIKILESKFDLRHKTKRKLWSGKHLTTSSVLSNVQVFPDYRLAYTEKIIRIKNNYTNGRWNREEEALYTFHLPEGSVATSLSLWINGKEEKSRLSTKSKADSAYVSIVGVERRDPSILHWQEGNTITVYVFPCAQEEERMFKIGITTPLKYENEKLVLQNIYFEGPDASDAIETSVIEFQSESSFTPKVPSYFEEVLPNKFQYTGSYNSYWEASCSATKLSNLPFSFNGKSYHLEHAKTETQKIAMESIYLDINKTWNRSEFDGIWDNLKGRKIFVYYDQLYQLNEENKDKLFEKLSELNFSLFPLDKIKDCDHSLLISKSSSISPTLADLKDSKFIEDLKLYLNERETKINLFSLSDELSPYLKTLKEFQVFNSTTGNLEYLQSFLKNETYIIDHQNENTVRIDESNIFILRDSIAAKSSAPDHLMRLFAYNKIMQDCGRNYFTSDDFVENNLIELANEAYIVSPISSLLVLESVKDYERFDIDENKNSLKNATTKSAGAVPEPHEWALIIVLSFTLLFLYYKRNKSIKAS